MTEWEVFEHRVQDVLGLEPTIASGNKWYDISDGVHRDQNPYRVMVDAKYTDGQSFMVQGKVVQQWYEEATKLGYKFALPIKLAGVQATPNEWVAIPLEDYAELVEMMRRLSANRKEQLESLSLVADYILKEKTAQSSDKFEDLLHALKRLTEALGV